MANKEKHRERSHRSNRTRQQELLMYAMGTVRQTSQRKHAAGRKSAFQNAVEKLSGRNREPRTQKGETGIETAGTAPLPEQIKRGRKRQEGDR